MKTKFHLKLESMCRRQRLGSEHWELVGSKTVRIPDGPIVTTKRAIYAAFVGEIPQGNEVMPRCELTRCVRPDHQVLVAKPGSLARSLALPHQVSALGKRATFQESDKVSILPKDITISLINTVKSLSERSDLAHIRSATGLPVHEILRIRNGVYDQAAKTISTRETREKKKTGSKASGAGKPPSPRSEGSQTPVEVKGITEEERQWLSLVGKG